MRDIPCPLQRELSEIVTIQRQDKDDRRNVETIAENVSMAIAPVRRGDTILPTGQTINAPFFKGMLEVFNSDIQEGDIIIRQDDPKLFVHRILPYGNHMQLELNQIVQ